MINPSRRSLIIGLGASLVAAPAIVRASSLMKVKAPKPLRFMGTELVYDSVPGPEYADFYVMDLAGHGSTVKAQTNLAQIRELLLPGLYKMQGEYQNIAVKYAEILNEPHRSIR